MPATTKAIRALPKDPAKGEASEECVAVLSNKCIIAQQRYKKQHFLDKKKTKHEKSAWSNLVFIRNG
jgi:hypothetical protein